MSGNRSENVGTQIGASDLVISGELDSGPPLGIEKDLVANPIGDGLLGYGFFTELPHAISESVLAPSNLNGSLEGDNVILLHGRQKYTSNLVDVNKNHCFPSKKRVCTVLEMVTAKRKTAPSTSRGVKRVREKRLEVGPDGRTLPQRLYWLMDRNSVGQAQLARMCSEYYSTFVPAVTEKVKQQHIFNLLQGQDSSFVLSIIAAVFDVSDIWLQFGIGPMERKKN